MRQKIQELQLRDKVTRDELQSLCFELQSEQFVLLEWATRTGKLLAGLNCATGKTLVVTPTHLINSMWQEKCNHKVICYASLHKELNDYDTVILDEAQHCSPRIIDLLDAWLINNPKLRLVLLSATIPYEVKVWWNKRKNFTWRIDLQQAVDWSIVPAPQIVCVGLSLKNDKRLHLYYKGKDKSKQNRIVGYKTKEFWDSIRDKSVNLLVQCTESEWFEMINNDIDYWKKLSEDPNAKVNGQIISNRIKMLGNERKKMFSQLKNRYIRKITNHFKLDDKRVIYFCNDIPQAEWLDERYAVHSKKKGSESLVEKFNEGEVSKLVSIRVLDEGVSVYNVDAAVIIQTSGSEIQNIQRTGRSLLSTTPLIIILYYKGTRDQEYVEKFVKQFNSDYVQWIEP